MHVSPDSIFQLLSGHMTAKYVFVAAEVGLFEQLAREPRSLDALAQRMDLPRRTLRILLDALVATSFLRREGDQYFNSEVTAAFLSGRDGAPDLRPILQLWNRVVYPQWATLEETIRTGQATFGANDLSPQQRRSFAVGIEALTAPSARALATTYDFARHRAVLDLGGGTGSFLFAMLAQHRHLNATLFELPATVAIVRERLARMPEAPSLQIVEGNFLVDPLPRDYDAVLLANVVHLFSAGRNRALFQRIRSYVATGTRLLLVDFWTDPSHAQPAFAALIAGEFQIFTGEGDVYSVDEVSEWLRQSGWRAVSHQPLAGAASLLVAEAVEPER